MTLNLYIGLEYVLQLSILLKISYYKSTGKFYLVLLQIDIG